MKGRVLFMTLLVSILGAGCASQPEDPNRQRDLEQASDLNADLGLAYMRQGRLDVALDKLEKGIEQNPKNGKAHHYLAELYRRTDKPDEASEHYRKALDLLPRDMALRNNYGVFLCDQGDYDEAFKYFFQVLDDPVYPDKAGVNENIGICALRKENRHMAREFLNTALKSNPTSPKSLLALAEVEFHYQDYKESYRLFKRYLRHGNHTPQSLLLGYQLEKRRGQLEVADSYAIILKGKYPESPEAKRLYKLETKGQ